MTTCHGPDCTAELTDRSPSEFFHTQACQQAWAVAEGHATGQLPEGLSGLDGNPARIPKSRTFTCLSWFGAAS